MQAPPFATAQRHFGAERVERMFSLAIAVMGLVFGVQTLAIAITSEPLFADVGRTVLLVVVMVALAVVIATAGAPPTQRVANIAFAVIYLVALTLWPIVTGGANAASQAEPWLWYLNSVAIACASQAFKPLLAIGYTVIASLLYGLVRTIGSDGVLVNERTGAFDASYAMIIGLIVFSLGIAFRSAARGVDEARAAALARYNEIARDHASQAERSDVDAIVHDTVLAALQAAERARTPDQSRAAVSMASEAITRLARIDAPPMDAELTMSTDRLMEAVVRYAESLDAEFTIEPDERNRDLPWSVGESLYLAAAQAMTNSAQHAGEHGDHPVARRVAIDLSDPDQLRLIVEDDGSGFVRDAVDPGRLGLRVSIIERVSSAGGAVEVATAPGDGTRITIRWPASPGVGR